MFDLKIKKQIFIYIIMIIAWMSIVFMFSNQKEKASTNLSKNITLKVIDILHKDDNLTIREKTMLYNKYHHIIRKMAHYTIYLIGGIIIIGFMSKITKRNKTSILLTILFGVIYAVSDEIHQYFIPGRSSQITDVVIDSFGLITGIIIYEIMLVIRNKKSSHKNNEKC